MIPEATTPISIGDVLDSTKTNVDPLDFAYFTRLSQDQWKRAKSLDKSVNNSLIGSPYADYMKSHSPVEKAGEIVFKSFLDYYCRMPYDCSIVHGSNFEPAFNVSGTTIDVHTRMLKNNGAGPGYVTLNAGKFLLMVPEIGLARRADIYVFCGFSADSRDGYAFGWSTAEEIAGVSISEELKHKAKCVSMYDIHPLNTLLGYIESL